MTAFGTSTWQRCEVRLEPSSRNLHGGIVSVKKQKKKNKKNRNERQGCEGAGHQSPHMVYLNILDSSFL